MNKQRLQQLAGLTEQHAPNKALATIIVVHDANPISELGDIMYEVTPDYLFLTAKGMVEDPREMNIALYAPSDRQAAEQDAYRRIAKARGEARLAKLGDK